MDTHLGNPLAFVFGAGMVAPNSVPAVWPDDHSGRTETAEGRIDDRTLIAGVELGPRELKKMDRMAVLALSAARRAWLNARCEEVDRSTCGIMSGNAVAGWTFTEPQLRKLYSSGVDEVSPYLASAWFPAAAQGQISIHMKLRGYAKTIATDRCAGTQAVGLAAEAISAGRGQHFLAGAAEAPLTPFIEGAFAGRTALAEGAAYLMLGTALPDRTPIAGIFAHATTVIPERPEERLAYCLQFLEQFKQDLGETPMQVDILIDSAVPQDRALMTAMQARPGVRRAWWVGDYVGDALAASGPIAVAALCGRYAATPDSTPAILISLGTDFATAIAVAAVLEKEASHVSH